MLSFFRTLLWPVSLIYRSGILLWDVYWRHAERFKVSARVISVGNIVAGGTGKTPLTIHIANLAASRGLKTAVVAGGYKRRGRGVIEVEDNSSWSDVGDEPLEIRRLTEGARVYVGESKTGAALRATADGAEIIVVDDGFQHRRLYRDVDIVCLDSRQPFESGSLLPSGMLREPASALERADIIVFTEYTPGSNLRVPAVIRNSPAQLFWSSSAIIGFEKAGTQQLDDIAQLARLRTFAFCGLASPNRFLDGLHRIGVQPVGFKSFGDHHAYSQKDIDYMMREARGLGAEAFLTTHKDAVKLETMDFGDVTLYLAMLEVKIHDQFGRDRSRELMTRLGL